MTDEPIFKITEELFQTLVEFQQEIEESGDEPPQISIESLERAYLAEIPDNTDD